MQDDPLLIRRLARIPLLARSQLARRLWKGVKPHLLKRRNRPARFPDRRFLTVRMDMVNRCNLKCTICYFSLDRMSAAPRRLMAVDTSRAVAANTFPGASALSLSCSFEPLLHPEFPRLLDIVAEHRVPETWICTNGTLLKEKVIGKILDAGITHLVVSMDAATPETYEKIRVNGDFEKLTANLRLLQKMKERRGSSLPVVSGGFTMMRSNIEELPLFVKRAAGLGMERVIARHLVPYVGMEQREEQLFHHRELANECLHRARAAASSAGIVLPVPDFAVGGPPPRPVRDCHVPWLELYVDPDGETAPCSYLSVTGSTGNAARQSLKEIWEHSSNLALRDQFRSGEVNPVCAWCLKDQNPDIEKEPLDVLARYT